MLTFHLPDNAARKLGQGVGMVRDLDLGFGEESPMRKSASFLSKKNAQLSKYPSLGKRRVALFRTFT